MRPLINPLAVSRAAVTGIIGAARLTGAGVRGASGLSVRLAAEALGALLPSAGSPNEGPAERGLVDEPLDFPLAPRSPRARPRPLAPRAPERPQTATPGTDADGPMPAHGPAAAAKPAGPAPAPTSNSGHAEPADAAAAVAPRHVSEEIRLAGEFADPGAEDGAGAQVRVEEPWSGYSKLRAREVTDRLVAEPAAVLSIVLLYERAHRARRSVLEAAERELRRRSSPAVRASGVGLEADDRGCAAPGSNGGHRRPGGP